ncbi:hypothetical protein Tco_0466328 [Tanacetum coccineum]
MASKEDTNAQGTILVLLCVEMITNHGRLYTQLGNGCDTQAEIHPQSGLPDHLSSLLNQTSTAKEIWDNVEMLMQGSGRTLQQRKEDLFDEYERFRAIGNESIHDYFVRFHKLVNDMKITQLEIPTHQMNTKFVKQSSSLLVVKYVDYLSKETWVYSQPNLMSEYISSQSLTEPHAKRLSRNSEQSSNLLLSLSNDALMGHMTQIANPIKGRRDCCDCQCKDPSERWTLSTSKIKLFTEEAKEKGDVVGVKLEHSR